MRVPIAQVKTLCTAAELELVKSSRPPQLNQLTLAEARRLLTRARGQVDKTRDLGRRQARVKARSGMGSPGTSTALKKQIFRDTLEAFEKRVQTLEAAGETATAKKTQPHKRVRTAQHRATRALVRKKLSTAAAEQQAPPKPRRAKPAAKADKTAQAAPVQVATPARKKAAKPKAPQTRKVLSDPQQPASVVAKAKGNGRAADAKRQLKAKSAAKQSRIAASGLTTRVRGHVSARGKRSQARRDNA